jgi:hypothetical protein
MDDLTEYDTCVILTLTFSSDKAFDDPASPVGQQWKSIVASLGNQAGWATFHWGRRVEQPDEVEVFIGRLSIPLQSSWDGDIDSSFWAI